MVALIGLVSTLGVVSGATPASAAPVAAVSLGVFETFGVLGPAAVGNAANVAGSDPTMIRGDLGVGGALTGFADGWGVITGTVYEGVPAIDPAMAALQAAYEDAQNRPAGSPLPAALDGLTLLPGVHTAAAATGTAAGGTVIFDGDNNPDSVFIIQVNGALALGANTTMTLANGAQAHNVFWQVVGAGGLGADTSFVGTLMAGTAVDAGAGSTINGRLASLTGAITMSATQLYSSPPTVTITSDSITNDPSPTITGITSLRSPSTVSVTVNGVAVIPNPTIDADGGWSFQTGLLANGEHTIVASAVDGAGNVGSFTQILTVDTIPPEVSIDGGPTAITNDTTPTISGTTDVAAGQIVTVTATRSAPDQTRTRTALVQTDLTWNITLPELTVGDWTVTAEVTDPAGNVNTATQTLTIDATAPTVTITSNALTNDSTPTITGITEPDATVTVSLNGVPITPVTVDDGAWEATYTGTDLSDGTHHVAVTATDLAGNIGTATQTLTVDTVAPAITINGGATDATNDRTPTISGTAAVAAGVTVAVTIDDGATMTAVVQSDGTWNATPTDQLDEGTVTVVAAVSDPAGNIGAFTQLLTIDVTAPTVTITGGASRITSDATPTIAGASSGAPAGSPVVVEVAGQTETTTVAADGTWSVTVATITNGTHVVVVAITDTAGNTGYATQSLTVDAHPPTVTITGGATRSTNDATPTISGTSNAPAGSAVVVSVAGQTLPGYVQPAGSWNVTADQIDNSTVTVTATVTDADGNIGTATQSLTVDSTTPTSIIIDGGEHRSTNDTTPTISGMTSAADGRTLVVTVNGQTLEAEAAGGVWSVTAAHLDDGVYTVTVTVSAVGGNPGSASQTLTIDTVAPVVIIGDGEPVTTSDPTPPISGSGVTPGSAVTVTVAGQTMTTTVTDDGTWTVTPPDPLPEGTHTIEVSITDPAGNTGTASQTITITGDATTTTTTAPTTTAPTTTAPTTTAPTTTAPATTAPTTTAPTAPISTAEAEYTSVGPKRVFDTRTGSAWNALRSVPVQQVSGGYELEIRMTDLDEYVPADGVGAVSLNVTSTASSADGFITVYACGARDDVSSVNFSAGETVANAVIAPVSEAGTVCFYSFAPTDIIADINGWFAAGAAFNEVGPKRVFDTRTGTSANLLRDVPRQKVSGGSELEIKMTDLAGYVPADGVSSVSLNVVVTNPEAAGFLTVYACGDRKDVSSVNYGAGQTVANAVIAPVSSSGTVCFYTIETTDVIVDINGWFVAGAAFNGVDPGRVLDTRSGDGPGVLRAVPAAKIGGDDVLSVQVTDLSGYTPASGVSAVSLNVTATGTEGPGFITVFDCGTMEEVSSLNYDVDATVANAVLAPVSDAGTVCVYSQVLTDVILDINGWLADTDG